MRSFEVTVGEDFAEELTRRAWKAGETVGQTLVRLARTGAEGDRCQKTFAERREIVARMNRVEAVVVRSLRVACVVMGAGTCAMVWVALRVWLSK